MSSRSLAAAVLLVALALAIGPVAGAGVAMSDGTGDAATPPLERSNEALPHNGTLPTPDQTLRVNIRENGNARWEVTLSFRLTGSEERAAFEKLGSRFESGNADLLSLSYFRQAAASAANETGRTMTVRNPNRTADIENATGRLTLSFTWTSFARVGDNTLAVGDAFNTTNGTWLPYLTANQALEIAPPTGYRVDSAPPVQVTNSVARWVGPVDFGGRTPWIVYAGDGSTTTTPTPTTTSPTPTTTTPPTTTPPGTSSSSLPLVLLLVVGGGGLALAVLYISRYGTDGLPGPPAGGSDTGGESGASAETAADSTAKESAGAETAGGSAQETEPGGGAETAEATGAAAGAAGAEAEGEPEEESEESEGKAESGEEIDLDLLSDEERVEHLLEQNGGRMKQANIVKETGWSNAKVSQLLSSMDEEDRIDKLRIGRENLISFPDEDIADLDSE